MTFLNLGVSLVAISTTLAAYFTLKYLPPGAYPAKVVRGVAALFVVVEVGLAWHTIRMAIASDDHFIGDVLPGLYACTVGLLVVNHLSRVRYLRWFMRTFTQDAPTACTIDEVVQIMRRYTKLYPDLTLYAAKGPALGLIFLKVGKRAHQTVALIMLSQGRHIELFERLASHFIGAYYTFRLGAPTQVALTYSQVESLWRLEDASAGPAAGQPRVQDEND